MRPASSTGHSRIVAVLLFCAVAAGLIPVALAQAVEADRITVRVSGDLFEILNVTPVTTVLPPTEAPDGSSGFWFELQATGGDARYRRVVGDPTRLTFEGPDVVQNTTRSAPGEIRLMSLRSSKAERTTFTGPVAIQRDVATDRSATSTRMKTMASPHRDEAIPTERVFTVLVPRAQVGEELVLFGPPPVVGNEAEPAGELARLTVISGRAQEVGDE